MKTPKNWKTNSQEREIEGTKKRIVLDLEGEKKTAKQVANSLDCSKKTIYRHVRGDEQSNIEGLNDMGVVHDANGLFELIDNNVIIKRSKQEYLPELYSSFVSLGFLAFLILAGVYYRLNILLILLSFFSAFSPLFVTKSLTILGSEEYIKVLPDS